MTVVELEKKYNFHDCDVLLPFEREGDDMLVTFILARHLQYACLKEKYGALMESKEHTLMMKVRFSHCTGTEACEWKYTKTAKRAAARGVPIEAFDTEMDFVSLRILERGEIYFLFDGLADAGGEIRFTCQGVDVVEECILDIDDSDKK